MLTIYASILCVAFALLWLRAELRGRRARADAALYEAQATALLRDLMQRRERRAQASRKGWATRRQAEKGAGA